MFMYGYFTQKQALKLISIIFQIDDDDDEDDVDVDGDDNLTDDKSGGGKSRRKSVGDSPLDALFQMASKTFEGLKAKSGKHD